MTEKNELLMPFDTDDPEFTRGVEVGMLWERTLIAPFHKAVIHASNAEMALRIAEARNLAVISTDLDDNWIEIQFVPQWTEPPSV